MILNEMAYAGFMTQWGLANGITALAKRMENPDRAYEMERVGSEVVELKASEWEELNN